MRIFGDAMAASHLDALYPVVRWTDRWGTTWEHKRGAVRQVTEGEDWRP